MRVRRLEIDNFRGIRSGLLDFAGNTLLVGGNNVGKSTVCEALDLVLRPERLSAHPVLNEHDFYNSRYLTEEGDTVDVRIMVLLVDLPDEVRRRLMPHLRRWDETRGCFADEGAAGPQAGDAPGTIWALPVEFIGRYSP